MTDEERAKYWPGADETAEVIRAYERTSQLNPCDTQMHIDYGIAFMK